MVGWGVGVSRDEGFSQIVTRQLRRLGSTYEVGGGGGITSLRLGETRRGQEIFQFFPHLAEEGGGKKAITENFFVLRLR